MRIGHTMFRVKDLDQSISFYENALSMNVLSKKEYPEGQFTLVFMGYGTRETSHVLELTYNWDGRSYEMGDAFGHIAVEVEDIYSFCEHVEKNGGVITRPPGPMKHGTTVIAFVEDPDGYKIELIEKKG